MLVDFDELDNIAGKIFKCIPCRDISIKFIHSSSLMSPDPKLQMK